MLIEFEVYKEKKNENGLPYLYLLRSQSDKNLYCVVKVEDESPKLLGESFRKSKEEIEQEDWELLSDRRKNIEKYLIDNMSGEELVELENNFLIPDENEGKTLLMDFEN